MKTTVFLCNQLAVKTFAYANAAFAYANPTWGDVSPLLPMRSIAFFFGAWMLPRNSLIFRGALTASAAPILLCARPSGGMAATAVSTQPASENQPYQYCVYRNERRE